MPSVPRGAAWPLLDRASSSCLTGFDPCTNADFPANFCCSAGSTCLATAANTTLVCCPAGFSCTVISTISCDVTQQDASLHPASFVKTTALDGALPKCGATRCCPFGYSCSGGDDDDSTCIADANQNASPIQTVPAATTATASASATAAPQTTPLGDGVTTIQPMSTFTGTAAAVTFSSLATTTSAASAVASTTTTTTEKTGGGPSSASVAGGIVGSLLALAIIGAAVWFFFSRRRRRRHNTDGSAAATNVIPEKPASRRRRSSSLSFGLNAHNIMNYGSSGNVLNSMTSTPTIKISSPILQGADMVVRTEFNRRRVPSPLQAESLTTNNEEVMAEVGMHQAPSARQPSRGPSRNDAAPARDPFRDSSGDDYDDDNTYAPAPATPRSISLTPPALTLPRKTQNTQQQPSKPAAIPPLRPGRSRVPNSEEINVALDPRLAGPGTTTATARAIADAALAASNGNMGAPPANPVRLTTFSGLMAAANLDESRPFVPGR